MHPAAPQMDPLSRRLANVPGAIYCCAPDRQRTVQWLSEQAVRLFGCLAGDFLHGPQRSWAGLIHHEDASRVEAAVLQVAEQGTPFELEYRLRRADGTEVWVFDCGGPAYDTRGISGISGFLCEITRHKQIEETLQRRADALRQVNRELDEFAYVVSHNLQEPLRALVGCLGILGFRCEERLEPADRKLLQHAEEAAHRTCRMVSDLLSHARSGSSQANSELVAELDRLKLAVLEVSEREQRRFGSDLHDGLCQVLTGIHFKTALVEKRLASRNAAEAVEVAEINTWLENVGCQARDLAHGLHPVKFEDGGLDAALRALSGEIARRHDVECVYEPGPAANYADHAASIHLYRIVQEAVSNAIRHGHARRIRINFNAAEGRAQIDVTSDGERWQGPTVAQSGMGLALMHYRASLLGAALYITPQAEGGTTVGCSLSTAVVPKRAVQIL